MRTLSLAVLWNSAVCFLIVFQPLLSANPINPFPVPEYDPAEAVVIRYNFNSNIWHIYEELIMECQEAAHVVLLVNNNSEKTQMENLLYTSEIPTDNITLLMLPANRMWVRDHGPLAFSTDTGPAFAQFIDYNGSGYNDQNLPASLAGQWGYQHYPANWILDGGNYMVDSHGRLFTTTRLYSNNPGVAPEEIQEFLQQTMGVTEIITVNPQHDDYWGHIDMQMKLLNDTIMVISSVDASHSNYSHLESNVAIIESLTAPSGNPYHIARLPKAENWKTYANALILNDKIIVPVYNHPNDQVALDIYSQLMPEHTVVGINCNAIIQWGGAIHCITMQVFEWEPEMFELTLDIEGDGGVLVNGVPYEEPVEILQGSTITVEAIADEGFAFSGWGGDIQGVENPFDFTVVGDVSISAFFERSGGNYMSIVPDRVASYLFDVYVYFKFARVISQEQKETGTSYYFAPTIEFVDFWCYSFEKSFLGEKMVMLPNGDDLFFNNSQDTIRIKTLASTGEEWKVYQDDEIIIHGTVLDHDIMEFMGITDSVKTIGLQVFNMEMSPIDHEINSFTLKLSKNHGLLQALNFIVFPHSVYSEYPGFELHKISLAGMTDPDIGVTNLTWDKVHDHQPGDELHVKSESSDLDSWSRTYSITRFLSRTDQDGEVFYEIERRIRKESQEYGGEETNTFNHDTIVWSPGINQEFDVFAGQPIIGGEYEYSATGHTQNFNTKTINVYDFYSNGDNCWDEVIWDDCIAFLSYSKGLGGPYYSCSYGWIDMHRTLVYYKKGETTWGNPLIITSVDEVATSRQVQLFPNPARDSFMVRLSEDDLPARFELMDAGGKMLIVENIDHKQNTIDACHLAEGMYFYRIISSNKNVYSGKLLLK